jgi:hypothetical protein
MSDLNHCSPSIRKKIRQETFVSCLAKFPLRRYAAGTPDGKRAQEHMRMEHMHMSIIMELLRAVKTIAFSFSAVPSGMAVFVVSHYPTPFPLCQGRFSPIYLSYPLPFPSKSNAIPFRFYFWETISHRFLPVKLFLHFADFSRFPKSKCFYRIIFVRFDGGHFALRPLY